MDYVIGVDGGGTKTEAVALSLDGTSVIGFVGGATNPSSATFEEAGRELAAVLDHIFDAPDLAGHSCKGMCLGLSGAGTARIQEDFRSFLTAYLNRRNAVCPVYLRNDAEIALAAALGKDCGMVAVAGTGSIVIGRTPEGETFRTGGWGHLLGDEGSGYQIGQHLLQAVVRSFDQVEPPTLMADLVSEAYELAGIPDLRSIVYRPGLQKQEIAAFARLCFRAADADDKAAVSIVRTEARRLSDTAAALIGKHPFFSSADMVLSGSVFQNGLYRDTFCSGLRSRFPSVQFHRNVHSPAVSAAQLAKQLANNA